MCQVRFSRRRIRRRAAWRAHGNDARGRRQPRGFTHWYYWTEEPASILAPGFFDPAADLMRAGDVVFAAGSKGALQLAVVSVQPGEKVPGQIYRQGGAVRIAEMCRDCAHSTNGPVAA